MKGFPINDSKLEVSQMKKKSDFKSNLKKDIFKYNLKIKVKEERRSIQASPFKNQNIKYSDIISTLEVIIQTDIYLEISKKFVSNLKILIDNTESLFDNKNLPIDVQAALEYCYIISKIDGNTKLNNLFAEIISNHQIIINMQLSHEILIYSRKEQVTNEDIQKYLPKLVNEFNINIHQVQNCPKNIYNLLNPSKNIVCLKQDRQLATEPKISFENISFINIPDYYNSLKMQINEATLKRIYALFNFLYLQVSVNGIHIAYKIANYLKNYKFITYYVIRNSESQLVDVSLCIEEKCLIIERIEFKYFKKIINILNKIEISTINVNNDFSKCEEIKKENEANEEINNFILKFRQKIVNNEFVKITIRPIIGYLIRRFFYPTNFFKDTSFFSFNLTPDSKEQELRTLITDLLFTNKMFKVNINNIKLHKILYEIKISKEEINSTTKHLLEFQKEDFIILRKIYNNNRYVFNLVIHLKSLYIFMMKETLNFIEEEDHEKYFCENYSHRCFNKFYGFVKEKNKIIGFIYEYLSNNSLQFLIESRQKPIDKMYSLIVINRISQGIDYLQKNSLVHRDLKPLNILLDHDYLPYISDFETIRKIDSKRDDYSSDTDDENTADIGSIFFSSPEQYFNGFITNTSDLYSFGFILYYLYENKKMMLSNHLNNQNLEISFITNNLQSIFKSCVQTNPEKRITNDELKKRMIEEINSFYDQEIYLKQLTDYSISKYSVQFIIESLMIHIDNANIIEILYDNLFKMKKYYELLNDKNNSINLLCLGDYFYYGVLVKKDYIQAKECYEFSALRNNLSALVKLGNLFFNGFGVEQNYIKAKDYFELAAKQNNSDALFNLGILFYNGFGVEQNYIKAKYYFELAAKQNNSDAYVNLGKLFENGNCCTKDYLLSKYYYELSAKSSNSNAYLNLGNLYFNGFGVEQNYHKAIQYYEISAKQNNSNAYLNLGNMYFNGFGIRQDYQRAKEYYLLSAKQNNSFALLKLGNIYENGYGVKQNYLLSKYYYELSAKQNNSIALYYLGNFFSSGEYFDYEISKAIQYFIKCYQIHFHKIKDYSSTSKCSSPISYYNNYCYRSGNDLGLIYLILFEDIEKSIKYIKEAAFGEFPFGQNNFGLLNQFYLKNIENAEYMYRRSSKNKFALAIYNLGYLKEKQNKIEESIEFYIKASEYEDEPLTFQNIIHYDKRLEISKTFIICLTNLKLTYYYLSMSEYVISKKYFIKSFSKIVNKSDEFNYKFRFQFQISESENIFMYLKKFILFSPLFNLINQPFSNIQDYINKLVSIVPSIEKFEKSKKEQFKSDELKIERKKLNNEETNSSEIKNINFNRVFSDTAELFDFVMEDKKLESKFLEEIRDICNSMETLIYMSPYPILFGRISIKIQKKVPKNEKKYIYRQNINAIFYEGFGLNIN